MDIDTERLVETTRTRTEPLGGRPAASHVVKRVRFEVTHGPDAGEVRSTTAARIGVGSHRGNDLVLCDPAVSRYHCELFWQGETLHVRDLGSRNGTQLDGVSVVDALLRDGALLALGRTQLRLTLGPEEVLPLPERDRFGALVGRSAPMRLLFGQLERAADSDLTVLLEGETGTGKEAAAQAVHAESARAAGPLVVVDCGSVPRALLESELFGHARGAFTGAAEARAGAFEAAHGGTLLLDEVGELPSDLQPKLLRALEQREIKRVGENHFRPIDVRIVAATHRDLRSMVNVGSFRADLYYRLAVLPIRIPTLRERPEDLPLLVEELLAAAGVAGDAARPLLDPRAVAELARHGWPGNVRELRNHLHRCVALETSAPAAAPGGREAELDLDRPLPAARKAWSREFERRYVTRVLARHEGNVSAAARAAGVNRMYFYRLLWRFGLR